MVAMTTRDGLSDDVLSVCLCGHVYPRHDRPDGGLCRFEGCDCGEFRTDRARGYVDRAWSAVEFVVMGEPVPQGDLSASVGKGRRVRLYHANAKALDPWRAAVAEAAGREVAGRTLVEGVVEFGAVFVTGRPMGHFRTGRFRDLLRDDAPAAWDCEGGADLDKLTRAVLDALSGFVYVDDRQVVRFGAVWRRWADPGEEPHATATVRALRPGLFGA